MPEVDARFEQLLHGDVSQSTSFVDLHPAHIEQDCYSRPRTCSSTGRIEHISSFSAISYQLSATSYSTYPQAGRLPAETAGLASLGVLEALTCVLLPVLLSLCL